MGALFFVGSAIPAAYSQPELFQDAQPYQAGTEVNLFAAFDSEAALDGLLVHLPADWTLQRGVVLRYGLERVPVQVQPSEDGRGRYVIRADRPLKGPYELIFRVQVGSTVGRLAWSVVPFEDEGSSRQRVRRERHRTTRHVEVVDAGPLVGASSAANHALTFADATGPLVLRREELPAIRSDADFTIEFWIKTTGLDEVVLSMWDGDEHREYPMEVVIDVGGRLRYYCGRPGHHQFMVTPQPIADGRWHHVALTHDASQSQVQLVLEGTPVDSLHGVRLPDAPSTRTVAVGGRVRQSEAEAAPHYSGWLDELRVWPETRSPAAVRRTARRTLTPAERPERRVSLGFETPLPDALVEQRASGLQRVASDLTFRMPVRDLRASVRDGTVQLSWTGARSGVKTFIVERSANGNTFETIGRVRPKTATQKERAETARYEYTDTRATEHVLFYRIRQRYKEGTERLSGTLKIGLGTPDEESRSLLIGNFPNPFTSTTTIAYEVPETQEVQIAIWDLSGQRVAVLVDKTHAPGYYEQTFQASNLPSGTYFVRLQTPKRTESSKMTLLK